MWRSHGATSPLLGAPTLLLALFPVSLFLWAFYSEGLFIALGAGAVWADRKERHWLAAVLLCGVSATRVIGIMVVVALVVARLWRMRRIDGAALLYGAAGLIALVAVSGIQWSDMGEPLAWTTAQRNWDRKASLPWTWVRDGLSATLHLNHAQRALDLVTTGTSPNRRVRRLSPAEGARRRLPRSAHHRPDLHTDAGKRDESLRLAVWQVHLGSECRRALT